MTKYNNLNENSDTNILSSNAGKQTPNIALTNAILIAERLRDDLFRQNRWADAYAMEHLLSYLCAIKTS